MLAAASASPVVGRPSSWCGRVGPVGLVGQLADPATTLVDQHNSVALGAEP
jgi:hypothetical protein